MGNICVKQLVNSPRDGVARGKVILIFGGRLDWDMCMRRNGRRAHNCRACARAARALRHDLRTTLDARQGPQGLDTPLGVLKKPGVRTGPRLWVKLPPGWVPWFSGLARVLFII